MDLTIIIQVLFQPHFKGSPLNHFCYFHKSIPLPPKYGISLLILSKVIFYKSEAITKENLSPINPDSGSRHYQQFRLPAVSRRPPPSEESSQGSAVASPCVTGPGSPTSLHLLGKAFSHPRHHWKGEYSPLIWGRGG